MKKRSGLIHKKIIHRIKRWKFRGFTLIESMVVVGVIGLAIGIASTSMNIGRNNENAQDAVRKSDLNMLHKAFVQYYVENRCIPPTILWDGYQCGESVPLELVPYLSKVPCDPETNEKYAYEPLDNTCKQCSGGCGVCVGFRLLTQLKHEFNDPPAGAGCIKDVGCGSIASNGKPYNYGIAMSNACIIPTPTYYPTPTPLAQKLQLTSMCSPDPADSRNWRVRNQNNSEIIFSWKLSGSNQSGVETVPAGSPQTPGEALFSTVTEPGPNTTIIYVNGIQQDVKASGGAVCVPTPTPTNSPTPIPPTPTPIPPTPTPLSIITTVPIAANHVAPNPSTTDHVWISSCQARIVRVDFEGINVGVTVNNITFVAGGYAPTILSAQKIVLIPNRQDWMSKYNRNGVHIGALYLSTRINTVRNMAMVDGNIWISYRFTDGTYGIVKANVQDKDISVLPTHFSDVNVIKNSVMTSPYAILQVGQEVWITNDFENNIQRFDLSGNPIGAPISGNNLSAPRGLALINNEVWVTNHGNNSISIFNSTNGSPLGALAGNGLSSPIGIAKVGNEVWVANNTSSSGGISRFTLSGNSAGPLITHPNLSGPMHIITLPWGNQLYYTPTPYYFAPTPTPNPPCVATF